MRRERLQRLQELQSCIAVQGNCYGVLATSAPGFRLYNDLYSSLLRYISSIVIMGSEAGLWRALIEWTIILSTGLSVHFSQPSSLPYLFRESFAYRTLKSETLGPEP